MGFINSNQKEKVKVTELEKRQEKEFRRQRYEVVARPGTQWGKGTLFFPDGEIIPDYPRMPRVLHLTDGIFRHYQGAFWVEEKVDGYNVRVFLRGDTLWAVTRSGNVCPFTLDKIARISGAARLLKDYPQWILCGEMGGLGNPYNYSSYNRAQKKTFFYLFDIMEKNQPSRFLPVSSRYQLQEKYGLESSLSFGQFEPTEKAALEELARYADWRGLEGLIFKPENASEPVLKYVTFQSVINDIEAMNPLLYEEQPEFLLNRLKRGTYFLYEHGQNHSLDKWYDFDQGAGKVAETVNEGRAYQEVETYFYDPLMADLFLELLKDMQIPIYDIRKKAQAKNKIICIKFKKELMRSSDIIKYDWAGNHRID